MRRIERVQVVAHEGSVKSPTEMSTETTEKQIGAPQTQKPEKEGKEKKYCTSSYRFFVWYSST